MVHSELSIVALRRKLGKWWFSKGNHFISGKSRGTRRTVAELPRMAFAEIGRPSRRMRAQSITTLSTIRMASRIRSMKWPGLCRLPLCRLLQERGWHSSGFFWTSSTRWWSIWSFQSNVFTHGGLITSSPSTNGWRATDVYYLAGSSSCQWFHGCLLDNKQLTTWVHGAPLVFSLLCPAVQSFPTRSPSTDWGVSWLELVVNFRLVTGCDIPIMLEWDHATASAEWLWPTDDKVNLLPFGVLGVARQIKVLSGCICRLERLGGKKLTFVIKGYSTDVLEV